MDIEENVARIRAELDEAARASGREPGDVLLIAASKMNDAERVRRALAAGVDACGENRVQELLEKQAQGAYETAPPHFIGHLQRNKARQVVGLVSLIHSVDSVGLLREIDRCAAKKGLRQDLLLEVNIAAEPTKSGFAPEALPEALETAAALSSVRVRGLMAIPPICVSGDQNRPYFTKMKQLFIDIGGKKYDNVSMDFLSMGMSGDYLAAVACGANMVRIGSAIFGQRVYPTR